MWVDDSHISKFNTNVDLFVAITGGLRLPKDKVYFSKVIVLRACGSGQVSLSDKYGIAAC